MLGAFGSFRLVDGCNKENQPILEPLDIQFVVTKGFLWSFEFTDVP